MKCRVVLPIMVLFVAVIAAQLKSANVISKTNKVQQVAMCYECSVFSFDNEVDIDKWLPSAPIATSDEPCVLPQYSSENPLIPKLSISAQSEVESADIFTHKSWQ